jgi:hypothetical protein
MIGWPEGIYLALVFVGIGIAIAKHGESRGQYCAVSAVVNAALGMGLLYAGGFFDEACRTPPVAPLMVPLADSDSDGSAERHDPAEGHGPKDDSAGR